MSLLVREIMTPFPHAIGLPQTLERALEMMAEFNVRHLPVQDAGRLIGILSDRDINFALSVDKVNASDRIVSDAFTVEPYIVAPDASVQEIAAFIGSEQISCALVAEGEQLVGIVTTTDLCQLLAKLLKET